ncbi:D-alanine--D-alanine ligase [Pandoraea terrae]|uniref:D-alanine--D-alanine ligase n=1 Tax=Pandoraea terrae TaxID=1537710 RepID=A0A5E4YVQ1_9BURK|nr:ATP-grasp domain-containing protein [Pandoraea terrae]VVE52220.1 D-alanine--D-alanine ligase [Pandoraea terrae]
MPKERIAIITGGDSSEREVALQTAESVAQSFERGDINYEVLDVPSYRHFIDLPLGGFTRVFLALHGGFGENGMAQAYLKGLGIPHNGPSPQSSAICMDKLLTKHVARGLGIRVPDYLFFPDEKTVSFEAAKERFGSHFIVKPNGEGCSIGVSLVQGEFDEFEQAVKAASSFGHGLLIEEFIAGQELSACYFYDGMLPTLAVGYTTGFFSFEAKFESDETQSWFIDLGEDIRQEIERDGSAFAKSLGLDYYRADVIISNGHPYLIEVNTLPGLTSHSLFPKACRKKGIGFDEMVLMLNGIEPVCTALDIEIPDDFAATRDNYPHS